MDNEKGTSQNYTLRIVHYPLNLTFAPTFDTRTDFNAGLAEPVDAMVSNTIVRKDMPVRVRHPVLIRHLTCCFSIS